MIKTNVRVIEHKEFSAGGHREFFIEILDKVSSYSDRLEQIGHIRFLTDINSQDRADKWYAMKFHVETERPEDLKKLWRLAEFVKENAEDRQPESILALIGAVRYFFFEGSFIPESYKGQMKRFKVISGDHQHYTNLFAVNIKEGEKELKAKIKKQQIPSGCYLGDSIAV